MIDPARVREPVNTTVPVTGATGETVVVRQFPGPGAILQDVLITALSPYADPEQHVASAPLSAALVDAIHRVTTDASRLTRKWYAGLASHGVNDERYVEALGSR